MASQVCIRLRQEDHKFKVSLSYLARCCLEQKKIIIIMAKNLSNLGRI
jgi:hypothetical protein